MMRLHIKIVTLSFLILPASGCDTFRGEDYSIFNDRAQTVGASQLIDDEKFESISLPALLAPDGIDGSSLLVGEQIDAAFHKFNVDNEGDVDRYRRARNHVQDRIVAASIQRCSFYKRYLKRIDQSTNVILGSLATITGAVGAIVTGVDAARALAGTAAIFSGLRAQFNEDMFASLAIHTITSGIDAERTKIRTAFIELRTEDQDQDKYTYTVEAAVSDALLFHGACNLVTGLKAAGAAAERQSNPGLVEVEAILKKFNDKNSEIAKFIAARIADKNGNSNGASATTPPSGAIVPPTVLVPAVPSDSVVVTPDDR